MIRLGAAVARHADQAEADLVQLAAGVAEGERKVAVDAAPDLAAFRAHADRFGDGELAVARDHHVRVEGVDHFGRARGAVSASDGKRQRRERRQPAQCAAALMSAPA